MSIIPGAAKLKFPLILASLLALHSSCALKPPELSDLSWQANVFHNLDDGTYGEFLSVSVAAVHPDGPSNLAFATLYYDAGRLRWDLERTGVEATGYTAVYFSGSRLLPPRDKLPLGRYRIRVNDIAGNHVETTFILSGVAFNLNEAPYPFLNRDGVIKTILDPVYQLYFFKEAYLGAEPMQGGRKTHAIDERQEAYLYAFSPGLKRGLITGPYRP